MSSNITDPPHSLYPEDIVEWREEHHDDLPADVRDDILSSHDALRQPFDVSLLPADEPARDQKRDDQSTE